MAAYCAFGTESFSAAAQSLAEKVAAIPGMHGSFYLAWENESSLTESQSQALRTQFSLQLNALRILLREDSSAPRLRVYLRETPSKLLFIAVVPADGTEQMRVVETSRSVISPEDLSGSAPRLIKRLLWRQTEPILDAAETSGQPTGQSLLLVLGRDAVSLYREEENSALLLATAQLPTPLHPTRDPRGRIRLPRDQTDAFVVDLPGQTCHGKLGEALAPACAVSQEPKGDVVDRQRVSTGSAEDSVLLASCNHAVWTLSSDAVDRTVPDHLLVRSAQSAAANLPASALLDVPGPVLSISGAADSPSSVAIVFNLATGEYEVYRIIFICGN